MSWIKTSERTPPIESADPASAGRWGRSEPVLGLVNGRPRILIYEVRRTGRAVWLDSHATQCAVSAWRYLPPLPVPDRDAAAEGAADEREKVV